MHIWKKKKNEGNLINCRNPLKFSSYFKLNFADTLNLCRKVVFIGISFVIWISMGKGSFFDLSFKKEILWGFTRKIWMNCILFERIWQYNIVTEVNHRVSETCENKSHCPLLNIWLELNLKNDKWFYFRT